MGIKKAKLDADFASDENVAKKSHAKKVINETVTENGVFDFYYWVQKFSASTLFR